MSESLHNMDDLFKKALQDHTDMPADSVWNNIDKNLDKKNVVSILKKYNKLKWAAALLLLFSAAMALYTFHVRNINKQLAKANTIMKQKNTENKKPVFNNTLADSIAAGAVTSQNRIRGNQHLQRSQNDSLPLELHNDVNDQKTPAAIQSTTKSAPGHTQPEHLPHTTNKRITENQESAVNSLQNPIADHLNSMQQQIKPNGNENINNQKHLEMQHEINAGEKNYISQTTPPNTNIAPSEAAKNIESNRLKSIETDMPDYNQNDLTPITPASQLNLSPDIARLQEKSKSSRRSNSKSSRIAEVRPGAFTLNAFYSPDISFKTVSNNHPAYRDEDRDEIQKEERVKYASTAGILFNYNFKNNWQITTGISYSSVSTDILPKIIYARPDNNGNFNYRFNCSAGYSYIDFDSPGNNGPAPGDSIRSLWSNSRLAYINIPVRAGYTFTRNRWSITPSAGISISFLTQGQIQTTVATNTGGKNATVTTVQGLKQSYMSATLGILGQYSLGRNFALSLEPTSRFGMETINKDAPVNTVLNSFGFAAGLVIKL
ncbi:MAG TPA: outer membrane beta-barrel protein [Chitinophagaceae bacterium]|nr:outer membrane beta-barrel protein [Chitinophagaceae bacterium]